MDMLIVAAVLLGLAVWALISAYATAKESNDYTGWAVGFIVFFGVFMICLLVGLDRVLYPQVAAASSYYYNLGALAQAKISATYR